MWSHSSVTAYRAAAGIKVAIPFKSYFERDVLMLQNGSQETLININQWGGC